MKAEQYLYDIMVKYRNKLVYDANTGEIRDERKHLSMLEDFWLPRREGGRGTEITTLPGGQNLGEIEDIKYFQKKLFQSLSVPVSRLDVQPGGLVGIGRTTEVTRDELKFARFVNKLRARFSQIFDHALRVQLSLKGICTIEEWEEFKEFIHYDFVEDNNFAELKAAELVRERVNTVSMIEPFIGKYFSQEWVKRKILLMTDEEIEEMSQQIEEENAAQAEQMQSQGIDSSTGQPMMPQDSMQQQTGTSSLTPDLETDVANLSSNINKK